jgi:hypothetical protein
VRKDRQGRVAVVRGAGSCVQAVGDDVKLILAVDAQIGHLGQVHVAFDKSGDLRLILVVAVRVARP